LKTSAAEAAADPRALRGEGEAIAASIAKFLDRTGLFDREAYSRNYPDVAKSGLDPLHHFVRVGVHLGRHFTSDETVARTWRYVLQDSLVPAKPLPNPAEPGRYRVAIYVPSLGNFFMREIADVVKAGFDDAAVHAEIRDEKSPPTRDATHHIVIAPHEFFTLGEGKRWATDEFVSRAILFATEQVQTQWFARSLVFLVRAKAVADMNDQNAAIFRAAGIRALSVQPGYSENFAPFAGHVGKLPPSIVFAGLPEAVHSFDPATKAFAARPLDVLFLGQHSPRRDKLLATYAAKFADLSTFLYVTQSSSPLTPAQNPMAASAVTAALLERSKILINLHRDEYTYFEWWRLMQAFWKKTVVVTEPCLPHPLFKPGVHYFEEAPRHIHHLTEWLAKTPEGHEKAEQVRARAYRDLTTQANAKIAALTLLRMGGPAA
jgi:hypothetical protein